ncbi:MAG: hypothetical protein EHM41_00285 [Chloroflexi bacterium]|nr:MAG: hypothetical protein EHM41_00285 [Chloroflexota bacterium]
MLEEKKVQFLHLYVRNLSVRASALAVNVAESTAWEWMKHPDIVKLLEDYAAVQNSRTTINVDKLVKEIAILASSDVMDYFDSHKGILTFKDLKSLPPEMTRCIKSVEETVSPQGQVKLKIQVHDKLEAIERLTKVFGLEMERVLLVDSNNQALGVVGTGQQQAALPPVNSIEDWEAQVQSARRSRDSLPGLSAPLSPPRTPDSAPTSAQVIDIDP